MSPTEVVHRAKEQALRQASKRGGAPDFSDATSLPEWPAFGSGLRDNADDALREAVRRSADGLLDGNFGALGVSWPRRDPDNLFPPELWRLDPVSGLQWPGADRFCFDIPYRHERDRGDVKYVWEINRLQFLQPLAAAYALFDDKCALKAVDDAISSWCRANPPFKGLGWNSGIELALRSVSLLVAVALCGEALSLETRRAIPVQLAAHLHWIERFPSRFSSANNHRVAELMSMFLIATLMPTLPRADRIARRAHTELDREAGLQFFADGVPAEQSPTYGAFTAEMILLCALVARTQRAPLADATHARLVSFATYIAAVADLDGCVPAIGDDDEGRVLTLCNGHEGRYAASVARAVAAFADGETTLPVTGQAELRDAVFGAPRMTAAASFGLTTFADGGYTVMRAAINGRLVHLVMDHGPLGFLAIAAHGHADANAITLSIDGAPVLVDPGTYLYHSGGAWRDWFRGTRAHNTVTVEGADQSRISGPFNWTKHAHARLTNSRAGDDWRIEAEHDGYRDRFGVVHRRTVSNTTEGIAIVDCFEPAISKAVEVVFQFAPGLTVVAHPAGYHVLRDGGAMFDIGFSHKGETSVSCGADAIDGGWVSPHFGSKVAAAKLTWTGQMPVDGLLTRLTIPSR